MSKACLLLFLVGVVVFIITPSLANQHHDNELPKGKPFPGEKQPQHKPFPEHRPPIHSGPGGKGQEPPHGEKPPHRNLLSVEVEGTHKPPRHSGGKPPRHSGGKPPHVEGFPTDKAPMKPFPGEKPSKGKGKGAPHEPKPPHRHLLSEPHKYVIPPKGKGEKPPHEQKPHHGHHPGHLLGIEN